MKTCSRCIYNEETPGISFDDKGICNYCKLHDEMEIQYPTGDAGWKKLEEMAAEIKKAGKGNKYDCIIGVSGGCDSSYLLHLSKKLGLRPLAVHFDNTWNSKIAVENIDNVLKKLDIDLWTYVMDNEEFNDLALAMLEASVPEIDALTDIAFVTTLYMAAEKHKVKYIMEGHSFRTEGISPIGWVYFDGKYIEGIHRKFGKRKMERFPNLWLRKWMKWLVMDIKRLRPLYYVEYDKEVTRKMLTETYGWKWYGGHHHENRYCAYNHYLLNSKFRMDLRVVELGAFIRTGQITREKALEEMKKPQEYPGELIEEVKKRLKLSDEEYKRIMALPLKTAADYQTYKPTFKVLRPFFWVMYKLERVPKSFYIKYCF